MSEVVFKQWFRARADPKTPGLNVRHLHYIATRPGTVYNKGCGFGLWGQLPGDGAIRIQSDLNHAQKAVRKASVDHTLYRAVVSVGKDDAQSKGLYSRDKWEDLAAAHIQDIAKAMNIKPENLAWCASFHMKKNHPHMHILYWDNGSDPRPEFIPKPEFDQKAEQIRAAFSRDIHREEIQEAQLQQSEEVGRLRDTLRAICREANPEKILDLDRVLRSFDLEPMERLLSDLLRDLPAKGSLRYAYLPPDYKAKLDQMVDVCIRSAPALQKEWDQYVAGTRVISQLYGNGDASTEKNIRSAIDKLHKELGNEVMKVIRDLRSEYLISELKPDAGAFVQKAAKIATLMPGYLSLRDSLPAERIPVSQMDQIPGFREGKTRLVNDLMSDARLRLGAQSAALAEAQIDLHALPDLPKHTPSAPKSEEAPGEKVKPHSIAGKVLNDDQYDSYSAAYRRILRDLHMQITGQLREDAGWNDEMVRTASADLVIGFMRLVSRAAGQKQAAEREARNSLKTRSKDRSREAMKDFRTRRANGADWGDGLDY